MLLAVGVFAAGALLPPPPPPHADSNIEIRNSALTFIILFKRIYFSP
jgi:hypothetical protein